MLFLLSIHRVCFFLIFVCKEQEEREERVLLSRLISLLLGGAC